WGNISTQARDEYDSFRPKCGTVGCVAGWAKILLDPQGLKARMFLEAKKSIDLYDFPVARSVDSVISQARKLLGLTPGQAKRIFLPSHWERPWQTLYND